MFPKVSLNRGVREIPGKVLEESLSHLVTQVYRMVESLGPSPGNVALTMMTVAAEVTAEGGFALVAKAGASTSNSVTLTFSIDYAR